MAARRHTVILTESLSDKLAAWLAERVNLVRCAPGDPRFDELLATAEGLVIRTYTRVDEALLAKAPRLRVVGRAGVGVDNIDLAACARRGVTVVHTPDANTEAVVELVFAFMLDSLRPRARVTSALPLDEWITFRNANVGRRQLDELTLGILGLGRIGKRIAAVAAAFGMPVLYHDLLEIPPAQRSGAAPVDLDELLRRSDALTIHVDGRSSNRALLNAEAFGRLRDNVILINTSRGFVIDAPALARFLTDHPAAQAWLDVHEPEPIPADHPLLTLANAHLTPHIAGRTDRAMERMSEVVYDVVAAFDGKPPRYPAMRID